ncbi:hypothetical protein [Pigmentiphaga daeguensis]|uniref:Toprim domain-containing protein n=1 Tax=Pigmentiphaga daeguensis TaxID=414049 RepID=A0ABN1B8A3_9BURK
MTFVQFAALHGLVLTQPLNNGRVNRCPTETHPRSRNGAYRYTRDWGWVQDWAQHEAPVLWFAEGATEVTRAAARRDMAEQQRQEARRRAAAAAKAQEIVRACRADRHPYLERKGFPNEEGLIDYDGRLVVPMRDVGNYQRVQSLQWIDAVGGKKFLPGGAAKGGVLVLGATVGETWLCEGYATALSVRSALRYLHRPARVAICFSAGNLAHVAGLLPGRRFVVADNDASGTGARAAESTGLPWVMPPTVGHDANDMHLDAGIPALAALLRDLARPQGATVP